MNTALTVRDVIGISERLMMSRDYKKTLNIIVERAMALSGAERGCIVIDNRNGEFVIKAGFPVDAHGIGTVVVAESGGALLASVMRGGDPLFIKDPASDPRTAYMRELARTYGITYVVFIPLHYQNESLGVLVLDFAGTVRRSAKEVFRLMKPVRSLAHLAAIAIGSEYERRRNEERVKVMARLYGLGENSARLAHVFRNSMIKIGGFAHRLKKRGACPDARFEECDRQAAAIIVEEIEALEHVVNNVLDFSNPKKLERESVGINRFLREETEKMQLHTVVFECDLDKRLEKVEVMIDRNIMAKVLDDLVINAIQAFARRVFIKTRFKNGEVKIKIANNGERIDAEIIDDIFSPFVTTKRNGTGLGLANVRSIIVAHGGEITVKSDEDVTAFTITLPL